MIKAEDPVLACNVDMNATGDNNDATPAKGGHGHHDDEEPLWFGKGVVRDVKETLGTWWWQEMTNFQQKTIAVSL